MNLKRECAARESTPEAVAGAVGLDGIKLLSRSVCVMFYINMESASSDVTELKLPLLSSSCEQRSIQQMNRMQLETCMESGLVSRISELSICESDGQLSAAGSCCEIDCKWQSSCG